MTVGVTLQHKWVSSHCDVIIRCSNYGRLQYRKNSLTCVIDGTHKA